MNQRMFEGKVAIVTGGNSGIGRATAVMFAREGAKVVVAARRDVEGDETASSIVQNGGEAIFVRTDVADLGQIDAMVNQTITTFGRLDYAFNNAGTTGDCFVSIPDCDPSNWEHVIRVNLTGVWGCMKYQIPQMLRTGGGAIVNMSSVSGLRGGRIGAPYIASKHGVIGLTKSAAIEFGDKGIRVNAVCPTVIATPMVERNLYPNKELMADLLARHPLGRFGTPDEVAESVIWLCSDAASYLTGLVLPLDGGRLSL